MLNNNKIQFDTSGRLAVEARMKRLYGPGITVLKAKQSISTSIQGMIGKILTQDELWVMFGRMIYPDWAGQDNMITEPLWLYTVEANTASCYLVFKQLS